MNVEEYANKASNLYQQHGSPESAASALDKAAKVVEQKHPDIALRFYQHALEISMVNIFCNAQRSSKYLPLQLYLCFINSIERLKSRRSRIHHVPLPNTLLKYHVSWLNYECKHFNSNFNLN